MRYGRLFAGEEELSSRFGSLVFTGVEDDPETLATLKRMGFSSPERVAATIRSWHHGHIAATRTERGRELFTRLAPRLLDAANATGAPDNGITPATSIADAEAKLAEHHELAGRAKDMGSAAVFVLMMNVILVWALILAPRYL